MQVRKPAPTIDQLSEGQREVLALVADLKSSKQIARELSISPHTVDQRLKKALATLGLSSRFEAGRLYRAAQENASDGQYKPLVYPISGLATAQPGEDEEPSPEVESRTGDGSDTLHQAQAAYAVGAARADQPISFPALLEGRRNELTPLVRLAAVLGMTLVALLSLAAAVMLAEVVSRLF